HAGLERGPSAHDPNDSGERDQARGLHRERCADGADAARADARGVVGETPDDGRAGAEEKSFQLDLNLSAQGEGPLGAKRPRRHAHGWWTCSSRQSRSSLDYTTKSRGAWVRLRGPPSV